MIVGYPRTHLVQLVTYFLVDSGGFFAPPMSLCLLDQYEEDEDLPKRRYAVYNGEHGDRWFLTMTVHINDNAKTSGQHCIKNVIFTTKKPLNRMRALTQLFIHAVDFSKIPYVDDTITRIRLRTKVGTEIDPLNGILVPGALRHSLHPYRGVPLSNLECLVDKDDTAAIPYTSLEVYKQRYPHLPFVKLEHVIGIGAEDCKLADGVYTVYCETEYKRFVYKEPNTPLQIRSLMNEIDSLVLLSKSSHIIKLHRLVISENPYLTRPRTASSSNMQREVTSTKFSPAMWISTGLSASPRQFRSRLDYGIFITLNWPM